MADETGISWTDVTFNPWLGCSEVSPGCANCYAKTLAENRMGIDVWRDSPRRIAADSTWRKPVSWNRDSLQQGRSRYGGRPEERIRVFCASMADVFEPLAYLEPPRQRLFELIEATPELDWLVLTKRPEFARAWMFDYYMRRGRQREWVSRDGIGWGVLPNVWIGASVENSRFTWRADVLREIPAAVRFLSAEPLVDSLYRNASQAGTSGRSSTRDDDAPEGSLGARVRAPLDLDRIDWLIVGGESGGRDARPMRAEWARELRDDALERGIALHFKQWGSYAPLAGDLSLHARRDATERYGEFFAYRGPAPKSAGKLLDGVEYCEFPEAGVLA